MGVPGGGAGILAPNLSPGPTKPAPHPELACPAGAGYHDRVGFLPPIARPAVANHAVQPVRLLQITDPHLFADPGESLRGTNTHDTLSAVLDHIAEAGWPADLVAMTGDLIQDDSAAAYQRFREHFLPLGLPVLCVPGNHDVPELMREALSDPPFHYCAATRAGDWLIVGIDSCKDGSAGGAVDADELARLQAIIGASDAPHVLVCLHHPPVEVGSRWLDRVGLDNSAAFLDAIAASGRVRACLFGHVHQAVDTTRAGLRIIGTPSSCRQFLPDSDDFALDERPPAYRRIELHPDGVLREELLWVPCEDSP